MQAATPVTLIETAEDLAKAAHWLAEQEPRFATVLDQTGPLPLRRIPAGFAALLDIVMSQQVSVASASAIWQRLENAGLTEPAPLAAATAEDLRACGLSRQKIRYAQALAANPPDFDVLAGASDAALVAGLTALPGIGRWTAEVYGMFALGRADIFAAGDLALQEAARLVFDLPARPDEKTLRRMAEDWSPWRAVAARALWAYYRHAKQREGIL
ncbi:MAG: DNA-3-methyladenine glycosylase 2 family protein [Paracoccaceae bacterium]